MVDYVESHHVELLIALLQVADVLVLYVVNALHFLNEMKESLDVGDLEVLLGTGAVIAKASLAYPCPSLLFDLLDIAETLLLRDPASFDEFVVVFLQLKGRLVKFFLKEDDSRLYTYFRQVMQALADLGLILDFYSDYSEEIGHVLMVESSFGYAHQEGD